MAAIAGDLPKAVTLPYRLQFSGCHTSALSGLKIGFMQNPLSTSPLFLSSCRDVPVERLCKVGRVAEKGDIKPGFGIRSQ